MSQALYPNCLSAQTVHIQIRTGKSFSLIKTIKSVNPGNQGSEPVIFCNAASDFSICAFDSDTFAHISLTKES